MKTNPPSGATRPPNRLIHELSPYLKQHAYNPVDWNPWGAEALAFAKQLDKPIFLSIGYSACHWCHVMEHESFEDDDIARLMNEYYVCIKVDREERPDLDQIYMNAVQLMTRRGGWPMSVFLTPDLKPFFGGTYWPPVSRMGMPGFRDILIKVHEAWVDRRAELVGSADELTAAIREIASQQGDRVEVDESTLKSAVQKLTSATDRRYGGFGGAPKFPHATDLRLMLRGWKRFGDDDALAMARLTLDKMAAGGMYDQLGGGFHRYSTDERWLVPHFEKMLYDNALLTPAYLEAYQATGDECYATIVRETLDYVLREMTQPEGGFYSTQDADSEGEEGKFFVWTEAEIEQLLGTDDARIFNYCFDVSADGNWEGHSILNRPKTISQAAKILGTSETEVAAVIERSKPKLFAARSRRIAPGRDDKVLVSWNGMMIAALAQAAAVLHEPRYTTAARDAARFVLRTMQTPDHKLLHSYKDGLARFNAYLDDYAHFIDGLIDLYQVEFEAEFLGAAILLTQKMIDLFHDPDHGGFFYTSNDHEVLIARNKEAQDGATPSANGIAAWTLLRLGRITGRSDFEEWAQSTLDFLSPTIAQAPAAAAQALIAVDFLLGPTREIAIVDGADPTETDAVLTELNRRFLPNTVIVRKRSEQSDERLSPALAPLLKGKTARGGRTTLYICNHGACGMPVVGVEGLVSSLG